MGKKIVVALGHSALGKTFPEQKEAVKDAASAIADLVEAKYDIVIDSFSHVPAALKCKNTESTIRDCFS